MKKELKIAREEKILVCHQQYCVENEKGKDKERALLSW